MLPPVSRLEHGAVPEDSQAGGRTITAAVVYPRGLVKKKELKELKEL